MLPKRLIHVTLGDYHRQPLIQACIQQARALHPDWDYVALCDEAILHHPRVREIENKLVAFSSYLDSCYRPVPVRADLLRLVSLYCLGGVAMDADIFCLKPFDKFLSQDLLFTENVADRFVIGEQVMGAAPGDHRILEIIHYFIQQKVFAAHGKPNLMTCNLTRFVTKHHYPYHPPIVFVPHGRYEPDTPEVNYRCTENTHAVHLWSSHSYDLERLQTLCKPYRPDTTGHSL